jgi:gluconate 2-dehydrogenase alpha chain
MGNNGQSAITDAYGTYASEFRLQAMDAIGPIGGFSINAGGGGQGPIALVDGFPAPPGAEIAGKRRRWGAAWKDYVVDNFPGRTITLGGAAQCQAYRQNYLDLDPTYRDAWGIPVLRMTFDWTANEDRVYAAAYEIRKPIMEAMMRKYGGQDLRGNPVQGHYRVAAESSSHCTGGAIIGDNPRTSVVNKFGQTWACPNVWVIGSANFPQNWWMNPAGIIWALAYRAADAIVDRYLPAPGALVPA